MNKKILIGVLVAALALFGATAVFAGSSTTQTVTFQVAAINEISVSANPGALVVNAASAGSQPNEVSDATTTYNITTNGTKKITGVLNSAMPANVTLKITLAAPTVGSSVPDVVLSDAAENLVTSITPVAAAANTITYKLSATVAAGIVASDTRTLTLTITN